MMKSVADMILAYTAQAQAIGHMVLPPSDRS